MKPSRLLHWLGGAALLALLLPAPQAEAVIPSAFGPIQALIALLPQLLMALAALCVAVFKPRTYRLLGAYLRAHKGLALGLVGSVALLVWGPWRDARVELRKEQSGAPWPAFRGGPLRSGCVEGARGPLARPHVAWKFVPDTSADVDSSPAIVGNRAYIGVHHKSVLKGSTGSLAAVDTDTGRPAWRYDGSGDLSPGLGPVFSSPAVWTEKGPNDPAPAARWLVSGEGYHDSRNCRILCLDLEPARKGGTPKLHWSVQTTSHVESAPCIHEGRVTVGAGDDGVWCIELATGKVLWRIEGTPFYEVTGSQAGALSKLEGRTVVATGTVERVDLGAGGKDDSGRLVIDVNAFREHSGPPVTSSDSGRTFERTVTGRVAKGTPLRLEIETWVPDSESAPIGVTDGADPLVLFGSGLGGPRVNCADARTGRILWKTATPYPAFGPPTVAGDRVLIGVGNGNFVVSDPRPAGSLVCLSLRDGKELWTVPAEDTVLGALAVHEKRVYACSRDGNVYVLDLDKGTVLAKHRAGAAMVCSPAVTADSIYVSTGAGKLLCLEREKGAVRWSQALSDDMIFSSPAVAGGKVFIGTWGKGLVCLAEREAADENLSPRPWGGPGGGADRLGAADDRGLPAIQGDEAGLRRPTPEGLRRTADALAACGRRVYAAFGAKLACVNAPDGTIAWEVSTAPVLALTADAARVQVLSAGEIRSLDAATGTVVAAGKLEADSLALSGPRLFASGKAGLRGLDPKTLAPLWSAEGEPVGPPALAHGLVFVSLKSGSLSCLSETDGRPVWSVALETAPATPPTAAGDRVYVACAGKDKAGGFLECRKLVDGAPLWRSPLDAAAGSHVVASGDFALVATADDRLAVFRASDGKAREPLQVDGRPVAPALVRDTLVVAGETRIAAHDLAAAEWVWNFKDQDHIGRVTAPPVVAGETIWVATTARGLLAVGLPETAKKP